MTDRELIEAAWDLYHDTHESIERRVGCKSDSLTMMALTAGYLAGAWEAALTHVTTGGDRKACLRRMAAAHEGARRMARDKILHILETEGTRRWSDD